jgi:hypothetical protein
MKFQTGRKYYCTSICDSGCRFEYSITKRTEKSLWIGEKRFSIKISDEGEFIYPEGRYSMCPVLRAERMVV